MALDFEAPLPPTPAPELHLFGLHKAGEDPLTTWWKASCTCGWMGTMRLARINHATNRRLSDEWWYQHKWPLMKAEEE